MAFTEGGGFNAFVGGFSKAFLAGVTPESNVETFTDGVVIPEYAYICFQMTFAAITPALIVGAMAERMKFSAIMLFIALWVTLRLLPDRAHGLVLGRPRRHDRRRQGRCRRHAATPRQPRRRPCGRGRPANAGLAFQWGALDFAGGTVVHINAGIAGLVAALSSASASASARKRCLRTR